MVYVNNSCKTKFVFRYLLQKKSNLRSNWRNFSWNGWYCWGIDFLLLHNKFYVI